MKEQKTQGQATTSQDLEKEKQEHVLALICLRSDESLPEWWLLPCILQASQQLEGIVKKNY